MSVFVAGEEPENVPPARSRKKYETKYSSKYEQEYQWVSPSAKGEKYALCQWCQVDICIKSVGAKGLRDHEATGRHKQKENYHHMPPQAPAPVAPPPPPPPPPAPPPSTHLNGAMYPVLEVEGGVEHPSDDIMGIPRPATPQTPNTPLSPQEDLPRSTSTSSLLDLGGPASSQSTMRTGMGSIRNPTQIKSSGDSLVIEYDQPDVAETNTSSPLKKSSGKMTPKREGGDDFTTSTDDLTCNVCGREYSVWTQLKKHLVEHIMAAQNTVEGKGKSARGRGRHSGSRNSSRASRSSQQTNIDQLKNDDKEDETATTKRRGRPRGSRNKVRESIEPALTQQPSRRPVRHRSHPSRYSSLQESDVDDPPIPEPETSSTHSSHNDVADEDEEENDDEGDDSCPADDGTDEGNKRKAGPRQCRVCREMFYNRVELREHQRTEHNNGRPYQCGHCQKFFTTKNHMEVHVRHKHMSGPNPCQCAMCGKVLSSRTNLRIHMRIHKGERPFKCPVCHKDFSRKANMEMHMVYHTGERKFTCEVCGQSFFAINALKRHAKLHTGERDYACEICGATYVTGTDLRRHRLKHDEVKPYPCQLCAKQFTRSHDLKVHMRYHNKELRYTCEVCLKQFVESGNFKRHMRRHTGERPYSCAICLATFSQVHHLKAHMKNSHNDEPVSEEAVQGASAGRLRVPPHRNPRIPSRRTPKPQMQQPSIVPTHTHPQPHPHLGPHPHGVGVGATTGGMAMHSSQPISPPMAHQGTVVPGTVAPTHTTQIPTSGGVNHPAAMTGFLHQYNSTLYNHAVMPHYPSLFDMCPQQNCVNHLSSH
ncbi:zinc finger protein 37-like [Macrobrachium rosenbergii]|uniref:zinc finger protein 37-like n=1 Tax=Macrobrachium rosenbergii TaxID=79674 RepID=UPI0034D619F2